MSTYLHLLHVFAAFASVDLLDNLYNQNIFTMSSDFIHLPSLRPRNSRNIFGIIIGVRWLSQDGGWGVGRGLVHCPPWHTQLPALKDFLEELRLATISLTCSFDSADAAAFGFIDAFHATA